MPRPRKILWEYWQHPLEPGDEWVGEEDARPSSYMGDVDVDDDHDAEHDADGPPSRPRPRPVLAVTAAGLTPAEVYADAPRAFDLWVGHTTFNISRGLRDVLKKIEGVETLCVLTRYRFRVGIGLAFAEDGRSTRVRREIEEALAVERAGRPKAGGPMTAEVVSKLKEVEEEAEALGHRWVAYVAPNHAVDYVLSGDRSVLERRMEIYRRTQEAVGGWLYYDL